MAVDKINGFRAPYKSATFRELAHQQVGRNGLLSISGDVSQTGPTVTIPPFSVIQNGLVYKKTLATNLSSPSLATPYYVAVTAPTPGAVDNLIFTYAKSPEDVSSEHVLIAKRDSSGWRNMPLISIDGLINQHYLENVETRRVGPYTGLQTSIVGSDYVTTPGSLIDKTGEHQQFLTSYSTPIVDADPDWKRVDRILYRRPYDSPLRIGERKFVLGGTFASTPTTLYTTNIFDFTDNRAYQRIVVSSDNTAHIFCASGGAGSYNLTYAKISSDRQTVIVSPTIILTMSEAEFDVVIDSGDNIHVVYISSSDVMYQKVDTSGVLVGSSFTVDTQTGGCRAPRCKLDQGGFKLYIVYQAVTGSLNQIYFASRDAASGTPATVATLITETSGAINELVNPDIFVTSDYTLYIAWENQTDSSIYYQRFNDIAVKIDTAPIKISDGTTYGVGTLSGAAKNPRVLVSDNEVPFIAFLQSKGGPSSYGVAIWSEGGARMVDLLSPSENITSFAFHVDPIFNGIGVVVSTPSTADFIKIVDGVKTFDVSLSTDGNLNVDIEKDRLGSYVTVWSNPAGGAFVSKTVAESIDLAYSHRELESDILLARLVQPEGYVLNWVFNGRPGSFYDFLTAYGQSVQINWGVVGPGILRMGTGLSIIDLYSDTSYSVTSGDYNLSEGDALYVKLDGYTLTVTPEILPVAVLPWEDDIAVLGIIKDGEFNPVLLGLAGMSQLDDGESVIFGEDLDEGVRTRLGIISETTVQAYTSTIAQASADTYPQALSAIDLMAGQSRHVRPVRLDASWCVTGDGVLRFNSPCYIQIPSLAENRNEIAIQSISVPNDGDVVFVTLNRLGGAAAQITLSVAQASAVTLTRDRFILARRIGRNLVIDSLGRLFKPGDHITEVYDEPIKPVKVIDRTLSVLPTGSSVTIDGISLVDGDKVLFANSSLNKIYILTGVGTSISWIPSYEFDGSDTPTSKSTVRVFSGADINQTLWGYSSLKGWYRISTLEDFVAVRAADFTTTTLPSGAGPLVVDGVTILEGELVLYGNAALNKVYRVTGIGTALSLEPVNVFEGYEAPGDGSLVLAEDGSVSDVMWEYDEELPGWTHLSLTAQNKIYLGLTNPSKAGGEYQDQLVVGQLNNVVEEGDPLEKAIKRLDVRPDVLKRVRVIDLSSSILPAGPTIVIDGITLSVGDKVLFGEPTLAEGTGIFELISTGYGLAWQKLYEFSGELDPQPSSAVLVTEGSYVNRTVWIYNDSITPPWERIAGSSENIWTGPDAVSDPLFSGTFSTYDKTLDKALESLDKYFAGIQLKEHPTDKNRIIITGTGVVKTDETTLGELFDSRILKFDGAQIDLLNGVIYASDGITIKGTFTPPAVALNEFLWYGISFKVTTATSVNLIDPTIQIDFGANVDTILNNAPRPTFTGDYVVGAVWVEGAGPGLEDITQSNTTQIAKHNLAGVYERLDLLEAVVSLHTTEINELQNAIAAILSNTPKRQVFISPPGGTTIFNLNPAIFTVEADNTRMDVDLFIDGRWQPQSFVGDFSDGAYRKNSTVQIETAEIVGEDKEVIIVKRDAGGLFANAVKIQRFIATAGGQSIFTLDPLIFTVIDDNADLDADYYINGRWQKQAVTGNFVDGAVRKNSLIEVETAEVVPEGQEFTVVRRTPNGGGTGGGGGSTDLTNITVDLGFMTPHTVGTLTKPASAVILKDTDNTDVWKLEVKSGTFQITKIN